MHLAIQDGIVNEEPTKNIWIVISKIAARLSMPAESVPNRSTVEAMT